MANLVVATKDRNGNYTQYRYDDHGRRTMTIRGLTSETDASTRPLPPTPLSTMSKPAPISTALTSRPPASAMAS
jgi:YD repeat-containing protein